MLEAHFGVPMSGAALNSINVRLDAETVAYILGHCSARVLLVDTEFSSLAREAIAMLEAEGGTPPLVIDVEDPIYTGERVDRVGEVEYEDFLAQGDPCSGYVWPTDEWDTISINYTSGTTGRPKGVEYHHRGAWLGGMDNCHVWDMPHHATYLWTLPMFHCNGWCFPWGVTLQGGTHVCLRQITAKAIHHAFADHGVDHLCGAPIIMNLIMNAPEEDRKPFEHKIKMMTAAAPPPAVVLERMASMGIDVTHVYGLTEVYGPATVCAWNPAWNQLSSEKQAELKSRQGAFATMIDINYYRVWPYVY
jgi:fatty-acyl-CoA synthase